MNYSNTSTMTARDVFSYLLLIIVFLLGVVSFLTLLFQYINIQFPDQLDYWWRQGALHAIRLSIAILLVSWPVVILVSVLIGKNLRSQDDKRHIWIRKWLLHLMLFVSALAIIIDLITLINTYLNGEMSVRFALKVLTVMLVAVATFWYYLWELKRDPSKKTRVTTFAAVGSTAMIIGAIVASLFVVGSPARQRDERLDQNRVSDLQTIQSSVIEYWKDKGQLPDDLAVLEDDIIGYRNPTDPETGGTYEYSLTGELSFELCATFSTKSEEEIVKPGFYPVVEGNFSFMGNGFDVWTHDAGRTCFERTIDPDRLEESARY